jgi:hypothetical protein
MGKRVLKCINKYVQDFCGLMLPLFVKLVSIQSLVENKPHNIYGTTIILIHLQQAGEDEPS